MCPPHPLSIFSTFTCMHTPVLANLAPINGLHTTLCALGTPHPFLHQSHCNKPCLTGMHPQTPHQTRLGSMPYLHTLLCTFVHYFFPGFSYTHFTFLCPSTPTSLSHGPWAGKSFFLGRLQLLSLGAYDGSALRGG